MCDKCQQLETDIQRYRKRLERSLDPLSIKIQRSRRLLALGLDPLTMDRLDGVIQELVRHKPAYALGGNPSAPGTSTGFLPRYGRKAAAGLPARVIH
jgi:hypothetical protein